MIKIYCYELRRQVRSKFFLGLFAVLIGYSRQLLYSETIQGVANTAPFSPWSFGSYLAKLLPLLGVALLFFIWNQCNGQARGIQCLTGATAIPKGRYLLIKYLSILTAWIILALMVVVLGVGFLYRLFGNTVPMASLLLVSALALLPPTALLLGAGALAGVFRSGGLFVLMALALGAGALPGDLYGGNFFAAYPLSLNVLDPAFFVPVSVLIGKMAAMLIGIGLLLLSAASRRNSRPGP